MGNLIDFGGDGEIDLADLIAGLMNLSGKARQLSVARVEHRLKRLQETTTALKEVIELGNRKS
eukprot:NODE_8498_length_380_cov_206.393846.p1 GENE.NODE_8498_length_380_cov_206.393846~~NODE_8498_length_380_cov_206.393846.p1  ORF type:complete len:63 (-),score=29.92 NODE_8498_length_380_cov_206.393846:174-362(-)